jgi:carbamate kinase
MDKKRTIVVALGGNALQRQGEAASEQQQRVADETVRQLLPLIQAGHNVAIVHGNGPQVGNIVLHEEAINTPDVPSLPLEDSGAMSQGLIGFWLQQAFHDAFMVNQMNNRAVSVITQTIVSLSDPAFQNPTVFMHSLSLRQLFSQRSAFKIAHHHKKIIIYTSDISNLSNYN